jgi:hypothetical protein
VVALAFVLVVAGAFYLLRFAVWGETFEAPPVGERTRILESDVQSYLQEKFPGARVVKTELLGHRVKGGFGPGFDLIWVEVEESEERYWLVEAQPQWGTGYYVRNALPCSAVLKQGCAFDVAACNEIVNRQRASSCGGPA